MAAGKYVIGLTGGIGSGKSTVADLFAELGVALIDTDAIAHDLTTAQGDAMVAIREAFGAAAVGPDGALDRSAMRERVFRSPESKSRLEAILHPQIRRAAQRAIAAAPGTGAPYVLLIVPLLFEAMGFRGEVARALAVDCPTGLQVTRVRERSGLADDIIAGIMRAQIPRAVRLQLADDVIVNTRAVSDLDAQVSAMHAQYCRLARIGLPDGGQSAKFVNTPPIRHNSASLGNRT
jgi:dephospho-CoA kinase